MQVLSGSIVALVTPMEENGSVDFNAIKKLVDWHVKEGTSGIVAVGTSGESATLEIDEHLEVIKSVVKLIDEIRLRLLKNEKFEAKKSILCNWCYYWQECPLQEGSNPYLPS